MRSKRVLHRSIVWGFALSGLVLACPAVAKAGESLGGVLESHTLKNVYGKDIALDEAASGKATVIVFLGIECPLAKLYGPRLSELSSEFSGKGVNFIAVDSNKQDSLTELNAYVQRYGINFPLLKDKGNRLADAIGATRTPEVYLLDGEKRVVYQGAIDDQYGVGFSREKPTKNYLKAAIEDVLAGKQPAVAETKAIGCRIGRVKDLAPTGTITFNKHIAPILNSRCVSCHREGEIGPFTLGSYEDVLGWEDTILEVVSDNRMPPWNANPDHGEFANDARLSEREKDTLRKWVANGMPEGDPQDLPAKPTFTEGWRIPEPDQIFKMRDKAFAVQAEGIVDYQHFVVDPGWTEDKYIYAAEARPDNRSVVHHILVYVIPPGSRDVDLRTVLVGYAPGSVPVHYLDGQAMKVPAGSKLLFELHYTPNGSAQEDLSYAGVCFAKKEDVTKLVHGRFVLENEFTIPAGDANVEVKAGYRAKKDEMLISMTPHMHLRGKAFNYVAYFPNGEKKMLLDVPKYDFNWQLKYILKEPMLLPRGTKIICTAVYDNSEGNPVNPDPTKDVGWGDQSFDEMMIGFFDTVDAD